MKKNNGITLVALVITIIVLSIIAGIAVGSLTGKKGNIKTARTNVKMYELSEIQQEILEMYVKYKQTGNKNNFVGKKITWNSANTELQSIASAAGTTLSLKMENYDSSENNDIDKVYYKLNDIDLTKIGLKKAESEYIVNYYTGEVFDITDQISASGEALYIYVVK